MHWNMRVVSVFLGLSAVLAGCCHRYPSENVGYRYYSLMHEVFSESHSRAPVKPYFDEFCLSSDSNMVAAAETLLLHYSQHPDASVRCDAAHFLARFGTETALERALEMGRTELSAEVRADVWDDIVALLQSNPSVQVNWSFTNNSDSVSNDFNAVVEELLAAMGGPVLICGTGCGYDEHLLPDGISVGYIENAIIQQYARDDGQESYEVQDRIPFVPFYESRSMRTLNVRREIAYNLSFLEPSELLLNAFTQFSQDKDEAIAGPARELLDAWSAYCDSEPACD
ncbi:MAG: HEAT repeat domain-containing protein [Pontiellaceae bacterium]|nr:HEAT repeat domain-containing protein [Pontiellaceae bacterium]MBN2784693.1 HEAT repeat domain-containing protein [Pontiellaceae bacterium]